VAAIAAAAVGVPVTALLTRDESGSGSVADADRVRITTSLEYQSGDNWIVPTSRLGDSRPPAAPDCARDQVVRRVRWLRDHGGVASGTMWVRLEVVNDSDSTLSLQSLKLEKFERLPPMEGRSFVLCSPGAGDTGTQYVGIDLSARPPMFRFYDDTYQRTQPFKFAPEPHRPAISYIVATAGGGLNDRDPARYRWSARLRYTLGGRNQSVVIDDAGEPFDLTVAQFSN
jgi:hypothetical protein